uniref:Putative secreted protein n=1 Tax=Ixodes ricinus TaxID=34613 RepID=A0A6B0UQK5_IXORI
MLGTSFSARPATNLALVMPLSCALWLASSTAWELASMPNTEWIPRAIVKPMVPVPQHMSRRVECWLQSSICRTASYMKPATALFTWKKDSGERRNLRSPISSWKCGCPCSSSKGACSWLHLVWGHAWK